MRTTFLVRLPKDQRRDDVRYRVDDEATHKRDRLEHARLLRTALPQADNNDLELRTLRRAVACLLLALYCGAAYSQHLEVHFIDVGQGDAVLIRSPSVQNALYDGDRRDHDAFSYLRSVGVQNLDLVIASHADADHIGRLEDFTRYYRPRFFMGNGISHTTQTCLGLLEAVREARSQVIPQL